METLRQLSEPQNFAEQAQLGRQVTESLAYLHKTLLSDPSQLQPCAGLIAQLTDLSLNKTLAIPESIRTKLSEAIADWERNPLVSDSEMAYPLLVHSMLTNEPTYERKAQRIINKAYKTLTSQVPQTNTAAYTGHIDPSNRITDLYTVITLKTYVTRYSRKKITSLLHIADCHSVTPDDNLKLQTITTVYR